VNHESERRAYPEIARSGFVDTRTADTVRRIRVFPGRRTVLISHQGPELTVGIARRHLLEIENLKPGQAP